MVFHKTLLPSLSIQNYIVYKRKKTYISLQNLLESSGNLSILKEKHLHSVKNGASSGIVCRKIKQHERKQFSAYLKYSKV